MVSTSAPGNEGGQATDSAPGIPGTSHDALSWYAVQTRYRFEKKVAEQLRTKGVETFLPLREEIHRWSDRCKDVSLPLFPGYAFVRTDGKPDSRTRVLQTAGLISFVSRHGQAVSVPQKQIELLELLLARRVPCSLHPFLKMGQRVRIRGGCLHGLEGILSQTGERSLVVSIESIQRSVAIKIEGYEIELI